MTMNPSQSLSGVQPDDLLLDRMVERERQRIAAALRLVGRIDEGEVLATVLEAVGPVLDDVFDGDADLQDALGAARWRLQQLGHFPVSDLSDASDPIESGVEDVAA